MRNPIRCQLRDIKSLIEELLRRTDKDVPRTLHQFRVESSRRISEAVEIIREFKKETIDENTIYFLSEIENKLTGLPMIGEIMKENRKGGEIENKHQHNH